jgi:hypothetical protein
MNQGGGNGTGMAPSLRARGHGWPLDAWLATPWAPAGMAKNRIFGLETATAVDEKAIHSRALSQDGRAFRYVPWCSAHLPQRTLSGHPGARGREGEGEKEALSLMLSSPSVLLVVVVLLFLVGDWEPVPSKKRARPRNFRA